MHSNLCGLMPNPWLFHYNILSQSSDALRVSSHLLCTHHRLSTVPGSFTNTKQFLIDWPSRSLSWAAAAAAS